MLYQGFDNTVRLHPNQQHWYLLFIGVHPDSQGLGIGRKLMQPVLKLADERGELCYLETPFPETHEFYRSQGYDLRPPSYPFKGAPQLWTMVRRPRLS